MAPDLAVTPEHVRDVILQDLDRRTGEPGTWDVEFARKARDSWLFRAQSPLSPTALAVKVYSTATPPDVAARQMRALQHYHDGMADRPDLTVPAPWAALPEHRTLIMEWVDEERVDKLLRRARTWPERSSIIAAAGRWLRHFHDTGEQTLQPLGDLDLMRSVDMRVGDADSASARDRVFRAAYGVLQDNLRQLADVRVPFVTTHGDFSPGNLFHGPGRTVGFDFHARAARPAACDIQHFLVYARLFTTPARMRLTPWLDQRDLAALARAYGPLGDAMDPRLMSIFRLAEILYSWSLLVDRVRQDGTNTRRRVRTWRLRGMARHATGALRRG